MPPTIQSGDRNDRDSRRKSRGTGPSKSDIVSRVKYGNALPDIPFDPKFITYPFEAHRFVQYNATSLERNYKHELLAEHDLGVTIDLINPDTYKIDLMAVLDPADEKLLEEEIATPGDSKRSRQHTKSVSWLRKTEYISSEYNRSVHSSAKAETKVAYSLKKQFNEEDLYRDRDNQIAAIEKTFDDAKVPIEEHYSKPQVTPVEVLSVLPDFEMWIHPCAQVIFDDNPQPKEKSTLEAIEEMSQAMIRGMVDESGEQFVGYFLPTEDTTRKRKRDFEEGITYTEDEEYDYKLCKEYNWNVKNKASRGYEENYFMVFRKGEGVFYDELETRVRLSKRRALQKDGVPSSNSLLVVKNRPLNEQELALQEARLSQLDNAPPEEEEEEEEDEDEEEETKEGENKEEGENEEKGSDEEGSTRGSGDEGSGQEEAGEKEAGSGDEREQEQGSDREGSGSERGAGSGQESGAEEEQTRESGQESGRESGNESGHESGRESGHESGHESGQGSGHESGQGSGHESGQESGAEETQEHSGGEEEQEEDMETEEQHEEQAESGSEREEAGSDQEEGGEKEEGDKERERREEEEIFGSDADDSD